MRQAKRAAKSTKKNALKFEKYRKNMQPKDVHQCPLSGKNENLEYHRMMAEDAEYTRPPMNVESATP